MNGETVYDFRREPRLFFFTKESREKLRPVKLPIQYVQVGKATHSPAVERWPCCAVALRSTAWSEHGMGMAWQV